MTQRCIIVSEALLPDPLPWQWETHILRQANAGLPSVASCVLPFHLADPFTFDGHKPVQALRLALQKHAPAIGILQVRQERQVVTALAHGLMHPLDPLITCGPEPEHAGWIDHALTCWRRGLRRRAATLQRLDAAHPGMVDECRLVVQNVRSDPSDIMYRGMLRSVVSTLFDITYEDAVVLCDTVLHGIEGS